MKSNVYVVKTFMKYIWCEIFYLTLFLRLWYTYMVHHITLVRIAHSLLNSTKPWDSKVGSIAGIFKDNKILNCVSFDICLCIFAY